MKRQNKRKIYLKPHFKERWLQHIGSEKEGRIKSTLHAAMAEKPAKRVRENYFAFEVRGGHRAVCAIDPDGTWVFVTLLARWMHEPRRMAEKEEAG